MPRQEADTKHSEDIEKVRLEQARAMLELFKADRGRAAATLEEIKEWASAQDNEHLQLRVDDVLAKSERLPTI
jgi:hypothetical protein